MDHTDFMEKIQIKSVFSSQPVRKCFCKMCYAEFPAKMHTEDQYHSYVKYENKQDTHSHSHCMPSTLSVII